MNNLYCSGVSELGAVAETDFDLLLLLSFDKVLLGVPDFSIELSLLSRGERLRLLLWLSVSEFLLLLPLLLSERDGGGDRRFEDSDLFDLVSGERFLNFLLGGVRERDVDLDLE